MPPATLFAKDSDQNVCTGYLIATGGLDMEDRTLQYTLKTQRRLCVAPSSLAGRTGVVCSIKGFQFLTERNQIHRTRFQRLPGRWVTEQRQ